MKFKLTSAVLASTLFVGCASVPMETPEADERAKQFNPPANDNAGLYIYRAAGVGTALKKDIRVNGKCIGESAPLIYFYEEVPGDATHVVSTESEFSPNTLEVTTKAGENYFIQQYIKMGVFVGGADLQLVAPEKGKAAIMELNLAKKGTCSS